jgi:hypothetical protein
MEGGDMKMKKIIALGAVAMLGMVACVKPAQAATTYNFDIVGTDLGSTGGYHVVLQQNSPTQFQLISVRANPAGGGSSGAPNTNVDRITLAFWTDFFVTKDNVVSGTGTGGTDVGGTNWGAGAVGADTNTWRYSNSSVPNTLLDDGSNTFTTSVGSVINLTSTVAVIHVVGQDGHQYEATLTIVPEASSMAMFLPGLLPLGVFLRRRMKSGNA